MRMNIFGFQMAVKNFLKRNAINFLHYALILRRSVVEYNVFLFDKPLKGSKSLKIFKIRRFVLTSCQIYQNPFTQEKILKFWQGRTKKDVFLHKIRTLIIIIRIMRCGVITKAASVLHLINLKKKNCFTQNF
jgi:hypothetical protein